MSNIDTRHNVVPFVSGKSQALSGQRLAKVGYKTTTKTKAKFPNVFVSVPHIEDSTIVENMEQLLPYVRAMVQDGQDGVIKSLYESSGGTLTSVSDEEISIAAVIGYLEAEATGSRLTKEFLFAWFDENVKDALTVVIAEKNGFQDMTEPQMVQIGKMVSEYRGLIAALAGGATRYEVDTAKQVKKALEIASVDDTINKGLVARLDKMIEPVKVAKLALLD